MHLILTALIFAAALWATDANIANTAAAIAGRKMGGWSPGSLGFLMAGLWGFFYYLTHL